MGPFCAVCGSVLWLRWRRRDDRYEWICEEHGRGRQRLERVRLLGDPDRETDPTAKRFASIEID